MHDRQKNYMMVNPSTVRFSNGHAPYSAENTCCKQTIHYAPIKLCIKLFAIH